MKKGKILKCTKALVALALCIQIVLSSVISVLATDSATSVIYINANGGQLSNNVLSGNIGQSIEFSLPTRYGYDFAGYYTDSIFTRPFTDTVFSDSNNGTKLIAKWDDVHFGFESYASNSVHYSYVNNIFFETTDAVSYSGRKSMVYHYTAEYYNRVRTTDDAGNPLSYWRDRRTTLENNFALKAVKPNSTYIITYKYYFEQGSASDIYLSLLTSSGNIWEDENRVRYDDTTQILSCKDSGVWQSGKISLSTGELTKYGVDLCFQVYAYNHKDTVIYFDDINVYEITTDPSDVTLVASGGSFSDGKTQTVQGIKYGESYDSAILPTRPGYDFDGWYLDSALTTPFTDSAVTFENFGVTLYAKWQNGTGFESYYYDTSDRNKCIGYFGSDFTITSDDSFNRKNSLMLKNNPLNNKKNVAALSPLNNNTEYLVTFAYKVDYAAEPINMKLYSIGNSIEGVDVNHYASGDLVLSPEMAGKGWQVASTVIKTDFKQRITTGTDDNEILSPDIFDKLGDTEVDDGNTDDDTTDDGKVDTGTDDNEVSFPSLPLYNAPSTRSIAPVQKDLYADNIAVVLEDENNLDYRLYLDDFKFTPIGEDGIAVYIDTVSKTTDVMVGNVGDNIGLINRCQNDKRFLGWYSDENYTDYYYGDASLSTTPKFLYAKWQSGEGFENYGENHIVNSGTFGERLSIIQSSEQEVANSGEKFVRLNYVATDDTAENRYYDTPDNKIVLSPVESGRYAITFSYRVNSAATDMIVSFATSTPGNIWTGSTEKTAVWYSEQQFINKEYAAKGWQSATVILNATPKETAEYLYLYVNSKDKADYCIDLDDIIITKMDSTMSAVKYSVPAGYGYGTADVGVVGQPISLKSIIPTAGNVFYAWYTDSAYKNLYKSGAFGVSDITIYGRFVMDYITEIDFSRYPENYLTDNNSYYTGGGIVTNNALFGYKPTLKFIAEQGKENVFPIATADGAVRLEANATYAVTFDYDCWDLDSLRRMKIWFFNASADSYKTNRTDLNPGQLQLVYTSYGTTRTVLCTFTTGNLSSQNNALYICENSNNKRIAGIPVSINNIKIYRIDDGMNFVFAEDITEDNQYSSFGVVGMQSTLECPDDLLHFSFDGWYTDKDATTRFNGIHLNEKITRLYGRWEPKTVDFENYYFANSGSRYVEGEDCNIISEETGNKVMRYSYKPATNYFGTSNNATALAVVKNKTLYKLELKYRLVEGESDVKLKFLTAHRGNRWSFITDYDYATYTINSSELGKGWQTATIYFKTDFYEFVYEGRLLDYFADGLFITFNPEVEGDCTVDIDDVKLTNLDSSVGVAAFLNKDGESVFYTEASLGSTVPLASAIPGAYLAKFNGWYSDEQCQNKADSVTVTNSITPVYSSWQENLESFDNYSYADSGNTKVWSDKLSVADGTMRFNSDSNQSDTSARFRIGKLNNNTTYAVTYRYKTSNPEAKLNFMSAKASDGDVLTALYNDEGMYLNSHIADGSWHEATVYITTGFSYGLPKGNYTVADTDKNAFYGDMLYGYFTCVGNADMEIDSIEFRTIEAVYSDGYQALSKSDAQNSGGQALRARFGYYSADGSAVNIDGKNMTVVERGIVFRNANSTSDIVNGEQHFTVGTVAESEKRGYYLSKRTDNLGDSWGFDANTSYRVFSSYVTGFALEDVRYLGARGYIKAADSYGNIYTFYSSATKAQPKAVSELAAELTERDVHTFLGTSWDKYTIVHKKTMPYIYGMKIEELQAYAAEKGVTLNAVTEKATPVEYEIVIGDTTRPESSNYSFADQNSYVIAASGTKIIITGGSDIAIMQGVKDFIEYLKLKDSLNCGADIMDGYVKYGTYSESSDNYKLTMGDDFDGTEISDIWGAYAGQYSGSYVESKYDSYIDHRSVGDDPIITADGEEKQLVRLDGNGNLVLGAAYLGDNLVDYGDGKKVDFAAGHISTFENIIYQYGCLDIKIKTTSIMTQSLWVNGSHSNGFAEFGREKRSNYQEYDIIENYGSDKTYGIAVHEWFTSPVPPKQDSYDHVSEEYIGIQSVSYEPDSDETDITDDYHVYSFLWTDKGIVFAFDGKMVTTLNESPEFKYRTPNYLNMNVKIAHKTYPESIPFVLGSGQPNYYENLVDYVKLYQVEDMGSRLLYSESYKNK